MKKILLILSLLCISYLSTLSAQGPEAWGASYSSPERAGHVDSEAANGGFNWQPAADCPLPRFEAMGVALNGKLLVLGGFTSASLDVTARVHVYDPEQDSWSELGPLPGAETHAGTVVVENMIYQAGGFRGPASSWTTTDEVWAYDSVNDVWSPQPSLPTRRAALALVNQAGTLHAIGGLRADGTSDAGEHSYLPPGEETWVFAADLPNPRNHLGGASLSNRIYIVGGRHGWDEQRGHQAALHEFDPASGIWTPRADIPEGRSEIASSTFSTDRRVIVIGGSVMGVRPSADVWAYDPEMDVWEALPPLPSPRKGAVADIIGNMIVVTTGSPTGTDPIGTTWIGCCLK